MRRARVAWYVHHHGFGHLGRLLAIARHLDADVDCFSSLPRPEGLPDNCTWTVLEADDGIETPGRPPAESDPDAGGALHWAPLLHGGHRRRLTTIAVHLDRHPVSAFVIDVSVEVGVLARLLGIPTVLITQPGRRDDAAHLLAFRLAQKVIAPWPEGLLSTPHLHDVADLANVGGISRFDGRAVASAPRSGVLVLGGSGGTDVVGSAVDEARRAVPEETWTALGVAGSRAEGWSADPWPALVGAEIVIAWAGQNSVADLAAAGARSVVIPQARPFDEQLQTAAALQRAGLAVVRPEWPRADDWRAVLREARALQPEWSRWRTAGAAERAASEILATATEGSR